MKPLKKKMKQPSASWFEDNELIFNPSSIPTPEHNKSYTMSGAAEVDQTAVPLQRLQRPKERKSVELGRLKSMYAFCCAAPNQWRYIAMGMVFTFLILFSLNLIHLR